MLVLRRNGIVRQPVAEETPDVVGLVGLKLALAREDFGNLLFGERWDGFNQGLSREALCLKLLIYPLQEHALFILRIA